MPTLVELQQRDKSRKDVSIRLNTEEVLILDNRADIKPGQFVERKLRDLLAPKQRMAPRPR